MFILVVAMRVDPICLDHPVFDPQNAGWTDSPCIKNAN